MRIEADFLISLAQHAVSTNPATGEEDFQLHAVHDLSCAEIPITNFFSVAFFNKGSGILEYEMKDYFFEGPTLMFFSPYHPNRLRHGKNIEGVVIKFTNEFFWFHNGSHHDETLCHLFFKHADFPMLNLNEANLKITQNIIQNMGYEFHWFEHPDRRMIFSYLKSLLIHAMRLVQQIKSPGSPMVPSRPSDYQLLKNLNVLIHTHFKTLKRPSDYAEMLHITPGALTKATKKHYGKTVTDFIQECMLEEARRELALTTKTVKEIALALGFDDPYYFSRVFKKAAHMSPETYRNRLRQFATP